MPTTQLALPGVLPTRIIEEPNLWYDEDEVVYRLCYEVDDKGRVYRKWRENICTLEEYSGFKPMSPKEGERS